jgi:hypothetical protein
VKRKHVPGATVVLRMKVFRGELLSALAALMWLTGCASMGAPEPPSLEVPKPPTDLRATRKGNKVTLTWTVPERTTERRRVRYLGKTNVCRSIDAQGKKCDAVVGEAPAPANFAEEKQSSTKKLSASFVDTLPSALEQEHSTAYASYAVEVMNTAGRGAGLSNDVHVPLVPTLPPIPGFAAEITAQGITISWKCPPTSGRRTGIKYLLRIYRRSELDPKEIKLADVDVTDCVQPLGDLSRLTSNPNSQSNPVANQHADQNKIITSFLDQTFEWEKTYSYRSTVVSVVEIAGKPSEVEGDDTPEAKVFAHDVFPPAVPTGLQAVFSGPGQQPFIDLIWAPVTDSDLAGYNVYRHESGSAPVKLNPEPVKTPAFRDVQIAPGKTYFYSVSAVDQRGNESARSEEANETVGNQ